MPDRASGMDGSVKDWLRRYDYVLYAFAVACWFGGIAWLGWAIWRLVG